MKAYSTNIEHQTETNIAFRRVLFTGNNLQLVVMSLKPGEAIGDEVHSNVDQFFRIEKGQARVVMEDGSVELDDDGVIIVPAGTRHNVINASEHQELKLYTIYSPPQHAPGTLHLTRAEAESAHEEHVHQG